MISLYATFSVTKQSKQTSLRFPNWTQFPFTNLMHSKGQEHASPGRMQPGWFRAAIRGVSRFRSRVPTNAYTQRPDSAGHALHMHSFINLRAIRRFFPSFSPLPLKSSQPSSFLILRHTASQPRAHPPALVTSFRNHGGWVSRVQLVNVGYRSRIQNSSYIYPTLMARYLPINCL